MQSKNSLPQLAVALTDDCNYQCYYCRPSGSSICKCEQSLPFEEIIRLLSIAYRKGFRVFRLTGGEPLLRCDVFEVIKKINDFGPDVKILLGTNGVLLNKYIQKFNNYRNIKFFISLDTIAQNHKSSPKFLTDELLKSLKVLSKTHFLRINMLVLNSNKKNVHEMIDFCSSLKIDLKLHDLYYCETILDPVLSPESFFDNEYCNLTELIPYLSSHSDKISQYPENASECGIPMLNFRIKGINVIIKDSLKGSYYNKACRACKIYPCLHGLYCPIIASDGTLQPSNCINKQFHKLIAYQDENSVKQAFDFVLSSIENSDYEPIRISSLNVNKEVQEVELLSKIIKTSDTIIC